ncbi:uncharacterized protein [Rutidosis leptorrhynchoides]|uniref:uncharacterized protein n=1 Tax=Rutidosis leptorrhynchoides TaxID=125765 RepID=UPI003A99433A
MDNNNKDDVPPHSFVYYGVRFVNEDVEVLRKKYKFVDPDDDYFKNLGYKKKMDTLACARDKKAQLTGKSLRTLARSWFKETCNRKDQKNDAEDDAKKIMREFFEQAKARSGTPKKGKEKQLVPSSQLASSEVPFSEVPSTEVPSTEVPSSEVPSSLVPFSKVPFSEVPSTEVPSSQVPSSEVPSSLVPYSLVPFSEVPSSEVPSSQVPSSQVPSSSSGLCGGIKSVLNMQNQGPSTSAPRPRKMSLAELVKPNPSKSMKPNPSTFVPRRRRTKREMSKMPVIPEMPFSLVPSTEVPSSEVPSSEVPSSEVPSSLVPSSLVPFSDVPSSDVPPSDVPAYDIPCFEVPFSQVPSSDVPSFEVPVSQVPFSQVPSSSSRLDGGSKSVLDMRKQDRPSTSAPRPRKMSLVELLKLNPPISPKPNPSKSMKPNPSKSMKPNPSKSMKPKPSKLVKPKPSTCVPRRRRTKREMSKMPVIAEMPEIEEEMQQQVPQMPPVKQSMDDLLMAIELDCAGGL